MSVISLKPCPFCGGEAVATYDSEYNPKGVYWVSCGRCGAMPRGVFNTEVEAIEAWNTRAERTCKPKRVPVSFDRELWPGVTEMHRLVCSECGCADLGMSGVNYCPNCGAKVVE